MLSHFELTKHARHKAERKLRTEHGQNPRCRVQRWRHLVLIEPRVQLRTVVANQTRQLVQLQLKLAHVGQIFGAHLASEHQVFEQIEGLLLVALPHK